MLSKPLSPERRKSLEAQTAQYAAQVGEAAAYLKARGINQAAANRFRLGHVTDSDNPSIVGRLAIPYLTPAGPVSIKYRCLQSHDCSERGHGKYVYDTGEKHRLFNAQILLSTDRVIVCEGELDVVAAEMAGVAAVGYPGTQAWDANPHWRHCFDSVTEISVVADGDDAGRKAAKKVAAILGDAVDASVRVVWMPDGEDTNSFLLKHDVIEFADKVGWL